jgi:hypothetical protein
VLALTSACQRADRRHSGRSPGSQARARGMKGSPTAAQYAAMPRLGEEAPVGEDVIVAVVGRVLQEDAYAMRLIAEPAEERRA